MPITHTTNLSSVPLFRRGKVRDVYQCDPYLLLVATDRISAFDVVMNEAIPDKGALLTAISQYWFETLAHIVPNHITSVELSSLSELRSEEIAQLSGRTMVVRRTNPLPIECVVRGYLAGSGWKEYQHNGKVCGIELPSGLQESEMLPEPIFTPATKAEHGHDENISFEEACAVVGSELAVRLRRISIELYNAAAMESAKKGLILADTKFEFGLTDANELLLIDEALTPDSSRYWLESAYSVGASQHNFDKQILRDWLETVDWNKQPPPPELPLTVIYGTRDKYIEAYRRITGKAWE